MRRLGLFDQFLFVVNSFLAFALLLSYLLPFVPPAAFPLLSVLSLGVPVLILTNILFMLFWAIRFRRQFLLSLIILIFGYSNVMSWIQFGSVNNAKPEDLSIMSYNVRMFNAYNWTKDKFISQKITAFVKEKNPDILVTQEHYAGVSGLMKIYPFSFIKLKDKNSEFGSAIFSRYPIIKKHSVDFPHNGNNNAIFVDIVKNQDTLRIFNVHLQSLNIKPEIKDLQESDSKKLIGRIGHGFKLQQEQAELMMVEVNKSPYKTIILGDFNNTAFSYVYKYIKGDRFKDAFLEAGSGFGKSFDLSYFPLRIDFILTDNELDINSFETFNDQQLSDHFPIMSHIKW